MRSWLLRRNRLGVVAAAACVCAVGFAGYQAVSNGADAPQPVVKARLAPFGEGLQVLIYCRDREALFARICGYFERAGFNIAEAKIHTTRNGYALDTFVVMGQGGGVHYRDMIGLIETGLAREVDSQAPLAPPRGGRLSRRVRHFPISPAVDIRPDERGAFHVLSIVASVLAGQPDPPKYFAEMKKLNRDGPAILGGFRQPPRLDREALGRALSAGAGQPNARGSAASTMSGRMRCWWS